MIAKALNLDISKRYTTTLDLINDISRIDGNLDWKYLPTNAGNLEWIEVNEETYVERRVIATYSNGTWNIDVSKDNRPQKHLIQKNLHVSKLFPTLDSILHKSWSRGKK